MLEKTPSSKRLLSLLLLLVCVIGSPAFANRANNLDLGVELTVFNATCLGGNDDGAITTTVGGGVPPYTYLWNTGSTATGLVDLVPGDYSVTVTDATNNTAAATATVIATTPLELFMGASYETCVGSSDGNVSVNVTGGTEFYTYLWNTGDDFVVVNDLPAGTYTVTVTDTQTGCTAVGSVDLELSPEGIWLMSSSTDVTCNGAADGTGYVGVMTGVAPYNIVWSDNQTGPNATNLGPGTYTVTVTDANGCSNADSVTISEPPAIIIALDGVQDETCGQADGAINITVSGGNPGTPPYTYLWSNNATTEDISGLTAGDYSVTVTDGDGCTRVAGPIQVGDDCIPNSCTADAGTLSIDASPVCFENGSAAISATPTGNAVVPTGYSTIYVLSSGAGLVIQQTNATPDFVVSAVGDYTIHTLVYDPNTLDLSTVQLGTTTGFDVNGLLIQGGGTICASLDVPGAPVVIEDCPEPCTADAGTLSINASPVCFENGAAAISATPAGNAVVPTGYSTIYVLTSGTGLVIQQTNATPDFVVSAVGDYTIHTLVYDPNTLDLSTIQLGTTTGFDVNGLLIQGGGTICASLDVPGAPVVIEVCCSTPVIQSVVVIEATCGNADGSATITMVGGNGTYVYDWSPDLGVPNSIGNARTQLPSGTYTVTISNSMPNCPSLIETFTIGNSDSPNATIVSTTPATCNETNGTAVMSEIGFEYLWCNGETGYNPIALAAGTCQVTITDPATGCTDIMEVVIDVFNPLMATVVVDVHPDCGVANGTVTIDVTNGSTSYAYAWSNGGTNATETNLASGLYSVTVTDNGPTGCVRVVNFVLTDNVPGATVAITEPVLTTCPGTNDATLEYDIVYDPAFAQPATIVIQDSVGNEYTNGALSPGTYCLVVRDANGCIAGGDCFEVTEPSQIDVDIAIDNSCITGPAIRIVEVLGGNGGYTFDWADLPGSDDPQNRLDLEAGSYDVTVTDSKGCFAAANNLVVIDTCACPPIILTSVVVVEASCGNTDGKATINVAGNPNDYTYQWSGNESGFWIAEDIPAGTYSVTITNISRPYCSIIEEFTVGNVDGPESDFNVDAALCGVNDGSVEFTNATYEYNWNDIGITGNIRNNMTAGTYFVTITDPADPTCFDVITIVVDEESSLELSYTIDTAPDCGSANGSATINVVGGTNLTYSWGSSATQTNLASGVYEVVVTDNDTGCTGSVSFVLNDNVPSATVTLNAEAAISCPGVSDGTVDYTVNYSAGFALPATITIQDLDGNEFQNGTLSSGIYCVVIRDANNCLAGGDCFEVRAPAQIDVDIAVYDENCDEAGIINLVEVVGGNGGYSYAWTGVASADSTINNLAAGNYSFTVTDARGCTVSENLEVESDPDALNLSVTPDTMTCDGSITLFATSNNADTYNWSDANNVMLGSGPSIVVEPDGMSMYYVEVVNGDCSQMDSVMVTNAEIDVQVTSNDFACQGIEAQLSVINLDPADVLTFDWTPDDVIVGDENTGTPTILLGDSGITMFYVNIENQYGCELMDSITITTLDSTANAVVVTDSQCEGYTIDFEISGSNASFYTLYFNDPTNPGAISNASNPSYTYSSAGDYTPYLVLPPGAACFAIDTIEVPITVMETPLFELGIEMDLLECSDSAVIFFNDTSSNVASNITGWDWTFSNTDQSNNQSTTVVLHESQTLGIELIVTTEDGCVDTLNTELPVSLINEDLPAVVPTCPGIPTLLTNNASTSYVYEWSPADSLDNNTIPNPTATSTIDIPFTVSISDSSGVCSIERSVLLDVSDMMNLEIAGEDNLCTPDPIDLTASSTNAVNYQWSTDPDFTTIIGNNAILEDASPGLPDESVTYYVQATDANGCTSMQSINLTNFGIDFILETDTTLCRGDSTMILALFPFAYPVETLSFNWSGDGIVGAVDIEEIMVSPDASGDFILTVTNETAGCTASASTSIDVVDLTGISAVADPDTIFQTETSQLDVNRISGLNLTYFWTPGETLDDNGIVDPIAQPEETTNYVVEIVDDNGCAIQRGVTVTVVTPDCDEPYIFFPNAFSPNGDGANDVLYLRGLNVTEVFFAIYNRWGEKVFESNSQNIGWDGTFKGKELGADVFGYYLRVRCGDGKEYYKQGNVTLFR